MGDDSFEQFSDFGATLAGSRPVPGASLHSTILVEDNLIVGATLILLAQSAVAVAGVEGASPAVNASPEDPVAGPPERPAMTSPQGAAAQSTETAPSVQNERRSRHGSSFGQSEVNKVTSTQVRSVSPVVGASPEDAVVGPPEQPAVTSPQPAAAPSTEIAPPVQNERRSRHGPSFGQSEVNKVTWTDVGSVSQPGRYMFRFGWLSITAEDLAVWRQFPDASFTLCQTAQANGEEEYRLGIFDLGAPIAG
jgi:hypothetical protein